jgi:hypothetical protein
LKLKTFNQLREWTVQAGPHKPRPGGSIPPPATNFADMV